MTTLEFFEKELQKCERNLDRQISRNAPKGDLENINWKIYHYGVACEILRGEQ